MPVFTLNAKVFKHFVLQDVGSDLPLSEVYLQVVIQQFRLDQDHSALALFACGRFIRGEEGRELG